MPHVDSTGMVIQPRKATATSPGVKLAQGVVEPDGSLVVKFAQLWVRDLDGDVTVSGAMPIGRKVPLSSYHHGSWGQGSAMLPVGFGVISEENDWAVLRGRLLLDTVGGRELHSVLRAGGDVLEWSYGFQIVASEPGYLDGQPVRYLMALDVAEVSVVLRGAGIGTSLVSLSSISPTNMMVRQAAADNQRELDKLTGHTAKKRTVTRATSAEVAIAEAERLIGGKPPARKWTRK